MDEGGGKLRHHRILANSRTVVKAPHVRTSRCRLVYLAMECLLARTRQMQSTWS